MGSDKYTYPDTGDRITVGVIDSSIGGQRWADEEVNALGNAWGCIDAHFRGRPIRSLDFGSGTGRLLPELLKRGSVLAYDRDASRLPSVASSSLTVTSNLQVEDSSFDVILASHVLQHVSTIDALEILSNFRKMITEDGLLIILTSRTSGVESQFVVETLSPEGLYESQSLTQGEFDELVGENRNKPVLPVRFFSEDELEGLLVGAGFGVVFKWRFHDLEEESLVDSALNSIINNASGSSGLSCTERDLLIVAKVI